ncbi:MAG: hypothetical protein ABI467_19585 [Kofleriaceae bacterium]
MLSLAVALAWAMPARADGPAPALPATSPELAGHLAKVRQLYAAGDFVHAREELLAAYRLQPVPELLFALGQVEFHLHHYQAAIDYYERFTATAATPEQVALAQQAIGAARIELDRPKPPPLPPPPPPPHREWDGIDTSFVATAALAGAGGGALLYYAHHLAQDRGGTLDQYDSRVHHARLAQWSAAGCFAAGVGALATAVLRYRLHLVQSFEVHPVDDGHGLALLWERPL